MLLRALRRSLAASGDDGSNDTSPAEAATESSDSSPERAESRRRFLAATTATATVGLAGCTARLPGSAATVGAEVARDGNTLVWNYPDSTARDDPREGGVGYAAIRFRPLDVAPGADAVAPVLAFRLNSTVADIAAGESSQGYQADWFRFHIGVSRTYDGVAGLEMTVQPPPWPEIQTTYGYDGDRRELAVEAPSVNEPGTITVGGRIHPPRPTLPRELHCQFAVQASQQRPVGRTVRANGRATLDVSALDLPDSISVEA